MSTDISRARLSTRVVTKVQVNGWRSTVTQRDRQFLDNPWAPTFPCFKKRGERKVTRKHRLCGWTREISYRLYHGNRTHSNRVMRSHEVVQLVQRAAAGPQRSNA
jgi:hypothetical protein